MCFLSLEDESGLANVVITPDVFEANRALLVSAGALQVFGKLEIRDGVCNLKASRFVGLDHGITQPSRDCNRSDTQSPRRHASRIGLFGKEATRAAAERPLGREHRPDGADAVQTG